MKRWILVVLMLAAGCKSKAAPANKQGHFPERTAIDGAFDLYVDGKKTRTVAGSELGDGKPLAGLVPQPARVVLAHGDSELWIAPAQLAKTEVRLNRRGAIKLGPSDGGGGGGGGGGSGGGGGGEVRELRWIEVRTVGSATLPGEP